MKSEQLPKTYEPQQIERKIYSFWEQGGFFHADANDRGKKPFCIVMPPPNITGQLHLGHALDCTFQDILTRYKRMQGYNALWLPGTDHASIATEAKIVEQLRAEGLTKEQVGRDEFLKRTWAWREKFGSRIIEQLKRMGASCDWDRQRFTLDEGCSKAVREVFVRLYEENLIYRGERIINWCPHCRTSISDAEVEYVEQNGFFYHLRYPFKDGSGSLQLATTRPETLLGDTAVAVNPTDERYRKYVGKTLILPLVGREIPVVADSYVEKDFGTGVVKITPAHDPNDFEVGLRHHLPVINILTDDAHINENGGKYRGLDRSAARKKIVGDLKAGGYLVKIEPIKHNVGTCYRCHSVVEPRVSKQWFVKMKPLAQPAIDAVKRGDTRFIPERFVKTYFHWMENIRDWCISRQLWWGHRIPAWYCEDCGQIIVAREPPQSCPKCGSRRLRQDPDTLDTWFSSALWPFSTLGWPDDTPELRRFYPTDVLVTGYDIIFFWVARMIFSGLKQTGQVPFHRVFLHGIVRDEQGRKMSKSLGNGIDPIKVIDQYGADALRLMLVTGNTPGNDMRFSWEKVGASRNFANKLWNAARFILMNIEGHDIAPTLPETLTAEDRWIVSGFNTLCREMTENLDKYELGTAVQKLTDFIWGDFCDWYIELAKTRLSEENETADGARRVLSWVMNGALRLLHPFMPFITEEIWQTLPHEGKTIMLAPWPEYDPALSFPDDERAMRRLTEVIRGIRNRRTEMKVPPSKKARVFIATEFEDGFRRGEPFIRRLAWASEVHVGRRFDVPHSVQIVTGSARVYIPMGELVDIGKERARLSKEKQVLEGRLEGAEKKLLNQGFLTKAPKAVVDGERARAESLRGQLKLVEQSLSSLQSE